MRGRPVLTIAVLCLLVIGVLVVHAPSARAAVGPKTITVDGDPSDWTGMNIIPNTGVESNGEFVWNDAAGDDTGDGDYTYATAPDLNVTGLFDLREFRVTADASNLYILVRVGDLNNPWGGSDGFSTATGVLLIDTTRDTNGQINSLPNVNVAAGSGWEYYVRLGNPGWHATAKKIFDRSASAWAPIENKGDPATDVIEASIPLSFIGKDGYGINGATWRFFFFLQSHDGATVTSFRDVVAAKYTGGGDPGNGASYVFGGGADHPYDPEIMDIAFAATQLTQEGELNSYTTTTPATISSSGDVTFANVGFVFDTTAPTVSGIVATPTFNSATVSWTTDEVANGTVLWGSASGALTNQRPQPAFTTTHSVTIGGLQPQRTYYYKIVAWDIARNRQETTEASFTTTAAPPSNRASWVGTTFVWEDQLGDDLGDGNYVYPLEASVSWTGKADITWINMTRTSTALHINAKVSANPSSDWHQRMAAIAIFIDQDHQVGSGARWVGLVGNEASQIVFNQHPMNLSVAPNFGWEYMVVANFMNRSEPSINDPTGRGEMMVFNDTYNALQKRYSLIYLSSAPSLSPEPQTGQIYARNGNVVDIWLNHSVLGTSDNWTYLIAGLVYDDAARPFQDGGIRSVKPVVENWAGGGANGPFNTNAYDAAFYPDTASQTTDLSNYATGQYANLTWGMQVNFGTQWHRFVHAVPVTHNYAAGVSPNVTQLNAGQDATVTVTFTDKGAPVVGASVSIASSPSSAGALTGSTVKTTDSNGRVTFTFHAASVTTDTVVTFTATATNGTSTAAGTGTLTVKAPPTTPPPSGIDPLVIGGIAAVVIIAVVAAIALLMRARKKGGPGGQTGGESGGSSP